MNSRAGIANALKRVSWFQTPISIGGGSIGDADQRMNSSNGTPHDQKLADAQRIANTVLYEGYMLYPYRPSSVKNQQRWTFGGVYPKTYSQAQSGSDAWHMQTECPVVGDARTQITIKVRFLHLVAREVSERRAWQEAVEREVNCENLILGDLVERPGTFEFAFPASDELTPLHDVTGDVIGFESRRQQAIVGTVEVAVVNVSDDAFKISVRITNRSPFEDAECRARDEALMFTFVSTHTLLGVQGGEFVSLLNPKEAYREIVAACHNEGTWPILVGDEDKGERDLILSSPIILYDYPQIAPESAGDLFDGTEIDEILTLRILTLTDGEKEEMRQWDDHARELLERTESLPPEILSKLHGAMRSVRLREEAR